MLNNFKVEKDNKMYIVIHIMEDYAYRPMFLCVNEENKFITLYAQDVTYIPNKTRVSEGGLSYDRK